LQSQLNRILKNRSITCTTRLSTISHGSTNLTKKQDAKTGGNFSKNVEIVHSGGYRLNGKEIAIDKMDIVANTEFFDALFRWKT